MPPVVVNPDHVREFATQAEFEAWLAENHATATEVWIRIFKKGSGQPTITTLEAIDSVLCWGWIDAISKSWDEVSFVQRYTPRGRKSLWSQVNRDNVARLEAAGRMTEHGRRHVEAAKADGRWDAAYAPGRTMVVPADLLAEIPANPAALATFETLNKTNRFAMAFRLGNLRTDAARARRIEAFVEMLARGESLHPPKRQGPHGNAQE